MKLHLVPKLVIMPDPRCPIYKPLSAWQEFLPNWLLSREFSFIVKRDIVYCNPKTLDALRKHIGIPTLS